MVNLNLKAKITEQLEPVLYKSDSPRLSIDPSINKKYPKILGNIRHYPPANKEWKNSVYAFNKNSIRSLAALDKMANKTIKSYFRLSNNKKLARSERMRNLIRRRTVKRLFVSKPEIKQTSDKVNITVYTFNRERQFFLRKMYFYNRNMNITKNVYLYKLWLKKNLLAFKKTFKDRLSIIPFTSKKKIRKMQKMMTQRRKKNKTYLHNILLKRYLLSKSNNKSQNRDLLFKDEKKIEFKSKINKQTKKLDTVSASIKNNLLKSLKKRNLMRFMQKREKKKIKSAVPLFNPKLKILSSRSKSSDLKPNNFLPKTFTNYLFRKISRKTSFKLQNNNSVMKMVRKSKIRKKFRFSKIRVPYSNLKFKNEMRFFSFKLVSDLKYIRKLFKLYFIKYLFYLLDIRIKLKEISSSTSQKKSSLKFFYEIGKRHPYNLYNSKNQFVKGFDKIEELAKVLKLGKNTLKKYIKTGKLINKNYYIKGKNLKIIQFKYKYLHDKLNKIEQLNLELLHFLKKVFWSSASFSNGRLVQNIKNNTLYTLFFLASTSNNKENLNSLYKNFEKKYFLKFLAKLFKKQFLYINYYSKFLIDQLKFGKFLPGLKILISKIYSKKVELNLVNLKYPHLNTDIYTEAIATKLRRKLGLLRVLKWSLNLVRLPYDYLPFNNLNNLNNLQSLTIHKSLDINDLTKGKRDMLSKDIIHGVLNILYPCSFVHVYSPFTKEIEGQNKRKNILKKKLNDSNLNSWSKKQEIDEQGILTKTMSVLNTIKYKWVSGVRLEAAGRLTRRYTAARSVFKFRYKGNLKNIDYSQTLDSSKKNISTVMLRNNVKSNSQYSFTKSKRRIGAFGLKAWIGGY